MAGGYAAPGPSALTEEWNGTSWTEVADLATARYGVGTFNSSRATLYAGGYPAGTNSTEEWTVPDAIKTFTAS